MNFLKNFGFTDEECSFINENLGKDEKKYLESNNGKVIEVLNYFKNIGVNKFIDLLRYRVDLLFCPVSYLEEKFKNFDKEFIKFIIEEDIQNLIILGI